MFDLITIIILTLFGIIIISSLIKGKNHFEYLKMIKPKKYFNYPSYFSVFTDKYLNIELQFLFLPFYRRKKELENEEAEKQAARVKKVLVINLLAIFLLIIFIIGLFNYS